MIYRKKQIQKMLRVEYHLKETYVFQKNDCYITMILQISSTFHIKQLFSLKDKLIYDIFLAGYICCTRKNYCTKASELYMRCLQTWNWQEFSKSATIHLALNLCNYTTNNK